MEKSDVVIIGGVAAGPKTAASLIRRQPGLQVTLFQKESRLSYASCGLPYFASGDVQSFDELTKTQWGVNRDAGFFKRAKGFAATVDTEVISINREKKFVTCRKVGSDEIFEHGYDKLVLATGGRPSKPPFPVEFGERVRCFTRPDDALAFRQLAERGQVGSAIVIGAGYIGCEMAEALTSLWGIETTVIEKEDHVMASVLDPEMCSLVESEIRKQGVTLNTGCTVENVKQTGESGTVRLTNGEEFSADFVFVCVGVVPETTLAIDCELEIGETGGIIVDGHFQTSDPDIYAGGDCVELAHRVTGKKAYVPLGSLANRHGWYIAENMTGHEVSYPGVLGAYLVKVFDLNIGGVGLNFSAAEQWAKRPVALWGTFADRPDYYPEVSTVKLKMIYDRADHRLLGLQAVGAGDVPRRIDTFSTFLQHQATLDDLLHFEHGYAPPYAEAVDPLHHLAGMALAAERGTAYVGPDFSEDTESAFWLDVREEIEQTESPLEIPGIVKVPLEKLHERLIDLPRDRKIVIVCQRGSRAYQASVFLRAAGFPEVIVLGGGRSMRGEQG